MRQMADISHYYVTADDYNSKVLSERGGAGQRVGYTKTGPRASPNRITQNHVTVHSLAARHSSHLSGETQAMSAMRLTPMVKAFRKKKTSIGVRSKP